MAALTAEDLDALAAERLQDAAALFTAGRYEGARYVCGYAIELKLKRGSAAHTAGRLFRRRPS